MKGKRLGAVACAVLAGLLMTQTAHGQGPAAASEQTATQTNAAQLDQMLAPIALYPDELLAQILMAAGYPLEVAEADRWLDDPDNAALGDGDLAAALEQQSWDPSVKSLVPFPQVLHMMASQLDWTESLGEAFIADPNAVADSIQRLRRQAEAAGELRTTPQEVVTDQDGVITITPTSSDTVDVPDYEPSVVYGSWPNPDYPPDFFPDYFGSCAYDEFGYCWLAVPIIAPLWGWDHWDWRRHRLDIDQDRFARLNHGQPPVGGEVWRHDPSHRQGVPYQAPAIRQRFQGAPTPQNAPGGARGYPPPAPQPSPTIERIPPTYESYGQGADVRAQAQRGASSRASPPSYQPRGGGGFSRGGGAPSGGGRIPR
jgi:hypothetical protein